FIAEHADRDAVLKIEVVPCGIDTPAFADVPATAVGPASAVGVPPEPDDTIKILCVATLYEVKGHAYLFEACARLVAQGCRIRCLLAGDGPDRAHLETLVDALGLAGVVTFLGPQPRAEIVALMHQA